MLGDAQGPEADSLRDRLNTLMRKYDRFAVIFAELMPQSDGPIDLEALIDTLPSTVLKAVAAVAKHALGFSSPPPVAASKKR